MRTAAVLFLCVLMLAGLFARPPARPMVCMDLEGPDGKWTIVEGDKDAYLTPEPALCIARFGTYRLEIDTGKKRLKVTIHATYENVLKWYRQHAKTYPVL